MNYTKILMSTSMIVFVSALVFGGTQAFFSDTETSEGNTFSAGAIDLLVDSESHYAGLVCEGGVWVDDPDVEGDTTRPDLLGDQCDGTWTETDLGPEHKFFNFSDLKPGDHGENTISLHVFDNDAYACAIIDNMQDDDNGLNEPEEDAGDTTGGPGEGELSSEIRFFAWAEEDGDNIWEDEEPILFSNTEGPASDVIDGVVYPLFTPDLNNGAVLEATTTAYIGLYWCYGNITVDENENVLSCDGTGGTNLTQTDSLSADITFYVEQARNNENFQCPVLIDDGGNGEPTMAASYASGFEPTTYSTGDINGQDGWKKTGPYDSEVVNDPVIDGLQSLRISNSVTSGSFGDQTFAPELTIGAGETGIAPENHFEAEFDIESTELSEQTGLAVSVSPDDGNGSRMSYLSFADEAGGIRVTFYDAIDAGPLGTVASFNPTDLGLISRGTSHTIKFVMDFVDGPGNDVVKIYIDGSLVHTGTSWEDYYRYDPEQAGNGNTLFPVDTLIFRASGTAAPANAGKGFLFDNISLMSGSL